MKLTSDQVDRACRVVLVSAADRCPRHSLRIRVGQGGPEGPRMIVAGSADLSPQAAAGIACSHCSKRWSINWCVSAADLSAASPKSPPNLPFAQSAIGSLKRRLARTVSGWLELVVARFLNRTRRDGVGERNSVRSFAIAEGDRLGRPEGIGCICSLSGRPSRALQEGTANHPFSGQRSDVRILR
jgi:hypothetical protein